MTAIERAVRRGGVRAAKLDRIPGGHLALVRMIERVLPRMFDPSAAGDLDATFALEINHPRGRRPDVLGLRVRNGALAVTRGRPQHAGASVSIGAEDMVRLATGDAGWPELLASKRLALGGDPFLGLRFPRMFDLPAQAGRPVVLRAISRS
jgi:SCP-2 sterol transfer family